MKFLLPIAYLTLCVCSKEACKNPKSSRSDNADVGCFKGRLEVKGGCMNYTIGMISKNFDTSMVVAKWTDEATGKSYTNVFALKSRCNFPDTIKEGDEFYFKIDSTTVQNCPVCLMYYPVPPKGLSIKVLPGPCQ